MKNPNDTQREFLVGDRPRIGKYVNAINETARKRRQWSGQEIGRIPAYDLYLKMEHQSWKCIYCGDKLTFDTCVLDHVYPLSRGGAHYLYNVAFACKACNGGKGARTLTKFCAKRGFDVDEVRQRMADINQKLHDMIFREYDTISWN